MEKMDIGIFYKTNFINSDSIEFFNTGSEPLVVVMNTNHPLANKPDLFLIDLKDQVFSGMDDIYFEAYNEDIIQLCRKHGFSVKDWSLDFENLEALMFSLQHQNNVTLLPESISKINIANLMYRKLSDEDCYLSERIAYNKRNSNPAIQDFIEFYESFNRNNL